MIIMSIEMIGAILVLIFKNINMSGLFYRLEFQLIRMVHPCFGNLQQMILTLDLACHLNGLIKR